MERNSKISFIVDTSAFISLESIRLLGKIIELFDLITTHSVICELETFANHNDQYGKTARRALSFKDNFTIIEGSDAGIEQLEQTDNELIGLATGINLPLITDDMKLNQHAQDKLSIGFSTSFLVMFVEAELMTKMDALALLEKLRDIRNWQSNLIYLTTKAELEKL